MMNVMKLTASSNSSSSVTKATVATTTTVIAPNCSISVPSLTTVAIAAAIPYPVATTITTTPHNSSAAV